MSGTLTPDSLSREGSPIPEAMQASGGGDDHHILQPPHLPQPISAPKLTQMSHDIHYSQSAPGSPSSSKFGHIFKAYKKHLKHLVNGRVEGRW